MPQEPNLASKFLPLTESTYFIMLSLVEPRHGYGVMQYVSDLTRGGLRIGPGTLYGALATMEERKMIVPVERDDADRGGSRRKEYVLTALGRQVLAVRPACLLSRWTERSPVTQPAGRQPKGKGVAGNGGV